MRSSSVFVILQHTLNFAKMPPVKRFPTIFITALFLVVSVYAQGVDDVARSIRTAFDDGDYPAAINALEALQKSDPRLFEYNNFDYLLGRSAQKAGDHATAMAAFEAVDARGSILSSYALWHLAAIARDTGNLPLERIYLQKILMEPDGILSFAASNRIARSYFESGDFSQAIRMLRNLSAAAVPSSRSARDPSTFISRENIALLGKALAANGQPDEAKAAFSRLINEIADPAQPDDLALAAVKGIEALQPSDAAGPPTSLSDVELLRRAWICQFNRDFRDARRYYQAILTQFPQSGIAPDAAYQIGRGFIQEGEFLEAANWFERVLEQFPEHPAAKDALLQSASAYSRMTKYREAITRYKRFIDAYPDDQRIDRAYLNIVDVLRDEGEENDALNWVRKTRETFKGKLPEALAVFAEARIFIARADWAAAIQDLEQLRGFNDLGGARVPGGTSLPEIAFLRAYCLEQLRRYPEAIDGYLDIPDGRNEYYGGRATARLQLFISDEAAKQFVAAKTASLTTASASKDPAARRKSLQALLRLTDQQEAREKLLAALRPVYGSIRGYDRLPEFKFTNLGGRDIRRSLPPPLSGDKHKQIADELLFLGVYDEAAPELEVSSELADRSSADVRFSLAAAYARGDRADRIFAFLEPQWRTVAADYQPELVPPATLRLLFPAPYKDQLLRNAPARSIDPRFVLAIMRQESGFRPGVKSNAAARGLMQFVSDTAEKVAGEVGRNNFRQDDLYDPATSILLGSQYIADLFHQFPNQPPAVAASYNGGADNMMRWLTRSRSNSPDQYVPEILFAQSKDYVARVMANYRMYQLLYDENLRPRQ
jgi:soluble lytic murein transglycosylase